MVFNLVTMRIDNADLKRMRVECQKLFIEEHPEMEGYNLSDRFMFHRIVEYYLK